MSTFDSQELLKKVIMRILQELIGSIEKQLSSVNQGSNQNRSRVQSDKIHKKFLTELKAIQDKCVKLSKIKFNLPVSPLSGTKISREISEEIEKAVGKYLVSLKDLKPPGGDKERMEAVQLGIGKALLEIDKNKENVSDSTVVKSVNWLSGIFKNLRNKINEMVRGRAILQVQIAKQKAQLSIDKSKLEKQKENLGKVIEDLSGYRKEDWEKILDQSNTEQAYSDARKAYVQVFNDSPKKAIGLLPDVYKKDPEKITEFLSKSLGVDKVKVAVYLQEEGTYDRVSMLNAYIEKSYNFKDKDVSDALRVFLGTFKLEGESQKIDRVTDAFSKKYCQDNPQISIPQYALGTLAFSIIMLNVDAHNPNVAPKNKMTKDAFIKNLRGTFKENAKSSEADFSKEMLSAIYDDITRNKITSLASREPAKQGGTRPN